MNKPLKNSDTSLSRRQIMSAADLLKNNPKPTREQIVEHMSTNICRCGTYKRIVRAVERAASEA